MKKHDLLSILFFTIAALSAGLVYFGFTLTGQIIFTVSMIGAAAMTKFKGAPLQSWIGVVLCAGMGYITGDWLLSAAAVCGFLAINLRVFALGEGTYTKAGWVEPFIAFAGLAIYVTANLIHDNHWQGWTFPAPIVALGVFLALLGFKDRGQVREMMMNGLIEIGSTAPDFSLENFDGKKIALSDYKGLRDMLLIFVRGDWCPGCHIMLRLYERERKKFQDKNVMLFAIGPDPVGVNRAMVEKLGVEFAVLSDETMEVSKKYCLQVQEGIGEFEQGVPLPASFLIDKQGIVRYTSRANNAGEFLRPDIIFDVLAKI